MQPDSVNGVAHNNSYFDITHSFKVGVSTYHVLGLRKDRPTYKNVYYIFHCTDTDHAPTHDAAEPPRLLNRPKRSFAQPVVANHRRANVYHTTTTSMDRRVTSSVIEPRKSKSPPPPPRARSVSPKPAKTEPTMTKEVFDKALRAERQLLMASFRREMNNKKQTLLRSIRKNKDELLKATAAANNKEDIIKSLQEQNSTLTNAFDQFVSTTASSIDALKRTLLEVLTSQQDARLSTEQLQQTLVQTIEQEMQNLASKNEEILQNTSANTESISELQETLVRKMDLAASSQARNDESTLNRLFGEQREALTHIVERQQQPQASPTDLIKEAMLDVLNQQRKAPMPSEAPLRSEHDPDVSIDFANGMASGTIHSLPNMKPSQVMNAGGQPGVRATLNNPADQRLVKVSVRTPESTNVYAKIVIDGKEYPRRAHTLCQRDALETEFYNCYFAPPTKAGPYELTMYAKTKKQTTYQAALRIHIPSWNASQSTVQLPVTHQAFDEHHCVLVEPLHQPLQKNAQVLIQMIVPGAIVVKIRNGNDTMELNDSEYKNNIVKKKVHVRGKVSVVACWDKQTETTLCEFNMT